MRRSQKFPPGFRIQPDTRIVQCPVGQGLMAVKVNEPVGGEQGYVVFTPEGVSLGELLTLEEVAGRAKLHNN